MTLPFYDELMMEKKPRVCGAVVFSKFMKHTVNCAAASPKHYDRKYRHFDSVVEGGSRASPPTTNNLSGTHRSLPSTNSSMDSSLLRPGSSKDASLASKTDGEKVNGGISATNTGTNHKARSCMPSAALNTQNLTRYQDLAKTEFPFYLDENMAGIKTNSATADTNQRNLDASTASKSPSAVAQRSLEMDKYFEQHVPSQNVVQFDPYMMMMDQDRPNAVLANDTQQNALVVSGMVSPVPEVSEVTCDIADPKNEGGLLVKSHYLRELKAMEEEEDNDDIMWNILYASGAATTEGRQSESTVRARESLKRELPISDNVINMLKEQREAYKSEAEALREEMEMFRRQLAGVRTILPQQKLREEDTEWEESDNVWDKVASMEFAQRFSNKQSSDELLTQHTENYFKKDWNFSFSSRLRNGISRRSKEHCNDFRASRPLYKIPHYHQHETVAKNDECNSAYISADSSSVGSERQRVSFSNPEVSHECEYDESCVTISVEPKHGTILPPRVQRWNNLMEATEAMKRTANEEENDDQERSHRRKEASRYISHEDSNVHDADVQTVQTDDYDYHQNRDRDVHYNAAHTQTVNENCNFYVQSQELEVIPEVDECELSTSNGEYTKDMKTVQNLLTKYGKRVSFSMDEQETFSVEEDMPLVQIENIDAVIEYRGAKDPDAWFERHANLSQEKEDREARRSKKISLTMALSSPKSGSQASSERRRRDFGEKTNRGASKESHGIATESNVKPSSSLTSAPTHGRKVGKLSRDTISQWENRMW